MKHLIIGITVLFILTGCTLTQRTPTTDEFDLGTVSKYEFSVFSSDGYSENIIFIENPEDIKRVNEFLGQTVIMTHSKDPCACDYLVSVKIFANNNEELFFGIEENSDGSFNFSNYSLSVIRFENKSYNDLMNLVKSIDILEKY